MYPKILRLVFFINDVAQRSKLRIQERNISLTANKNYLSSKEILALKRRHKMKNRTHMGMLGCHYCVQWKLFTCRRLWNGCGKRVV